MLTLYFLCWIIQFCQNRITSEKFSLYLTCHDRSWFGLSDQTYDSISSLRLRKTEWTIVPFKPHGIHLKKVWKVDFRQAKIRQTDRTKSYFSGRWKVGGLQPNRRSFHKSEHLWTKLDIPVCIIISTVHFCSFMFETVTFDWNYRPICILDDSV